MSTQMVPKIKDDILPVDGHEKRMGIQIAAIAMTMNNIPNINLYGLTTRIAEFLFSLNEIGSHLSKTASRKSNI